jgi:hypothetical protein
MFKFKSAVAPPERCRAGIQDIYIKAPRFIDHHLAEGRTIEEVKEAKSTIKKMISHCVDSNNKRKVVVDLQHTDHIAKSCIQILAKLVCDVSNFMISHPKEELHKKLLDNGFPEANILL